MRVIIDVMGAPEGSGGMNLYARELVTAWAESQPADELVVLGEPWAERSLAGLPNVVFATRKERGVLGRAWSQLVVAGIEFRRRRADALVSVSTLASPLVDRRRRVVIIHDWRHLTRPEEFGLAQKIYRILWKWSIRSAEATVAISSKTARETREFARPRSLTVVRNGEDHARRWAVVRPAAAHDERRHVVTFGHLPNKRPELAISAFAEVVRDHPDLRLIVFGARGGYRDRLRELAERLGVSESVEFPGFVAEERYQELVQSAAALMLVSSDEGFGLPVVEAAYFGVPSITTTDSGLSELHQGVFAATPDASAIAAALTEGLDSTKAGEASPRAHRWVDAASEIRELLV